MFFISESVLIDDQIQVVIVGIGGQGQVERQVIVDEDVKELNCYSFGEFGFRDVDVIQDNNSRVQGKGKILIRCESFQCMQGVIGRLIDYSNKEGIWCYSRVI